VQADPVDPERARNPAVKLAARGPCHSDDKQARFSLGPELKLVRGPTRTTYKVFSAKMEPGGVEGIIELKARAAVTGDFCTRWNEREST